VGAGAALGLVSVPDGLAAGLLAGVSPVAGLYAYLVGTIAGATATSSAFMTVQATGAMAVLSRNAGGVRGGLGGDEVDQHAADASYRPVLGRARTPTGPLLSSVVACSGTLLGSGRFPGPGRH